MTRSPAAKKYDKQRKLKKIKLKNKKKLKKSTAVGSSRVEGKAVDGVDIGDTTIETKDSKSEKRIKSIEYLRNWKKKREEWKFNKIIQIHLLRTWLNDDTVKDKYFGWFCDYCKGLPSQKKEKLSSEAVKLMESSSVSEVIQSRARQLVQSL